MNRLDWCAASSELRYLSLRIKLIFSFGTMAVLFVQKTILAPILVFCLIWALLCGKGKMSMQDFLEILHTPLFFLTFACIGTVFSFDTKGTFITNDQNIYQAIILWFHCMGCFSCLLFLAGTTPIFELISFFRRKGMPSFLCELMLYIYRYIFLMGELAKRKRIAQESRLGYETMKGQFHSFANLIGSLFVQSYLKCEQMMTAMESRLYEGDFPILEEREEEKKRFYLWVFLWLVFLLIVEKT